jgi:hypothetical protein
MDCAAAVALHCTALGEPLTVCDAALVHQMGSHLQPSCNLKSAVADFISLLLLLLLCLRMWQLA